MGFPRFTFLVHPLFPAAQRLVGARGARVGLAMGRRDGTDIEDVTPLARIGLRLASGEHVEGIVMSVPLLPEQVLADQDRALRMMARAVQMAAPVSYVGLGGVLSVVAGRGVALQELCGLPVTTGNAATAWAAGRLGLGFAQERGISRVGILGGSGSVGKAVGGFLKEEGLEVVVDPENFLDCGLVMGCHTTGGQLSPDRVRAGSVLVDVALPRSLSGKAPGVEVYKGESLKLPDGWVRDGWGSLLHVVAGYGLGQVYACVIEPLVGVVSGRSGAWAQGKRLSVATVREFGGVAVGLGFDVARVRLG